MSWIHAYCVAAVKSAWESSGTKYGGGSRIRGSISVPVLTYLLSKRRVATKILLQVCDDRHNFGLVPHTICQWFQFCRRVFHWF